jgi:hypothetical protein
MGIDTLASAAKLIAHYDVNGLDKMWSAHNELKDIRGRIRFSIKDVTPRVFEFTNRKISEFSETESFRSIYIDDLTKEFVVNESEENVDQMFMQPIEINEQFFKSPLHELVLRRVKTETAIRNYLPMNKIIPSVAAATIARYGEERWYNSPFIGMLKYYYDSIKQPNDGDPFIENDSGIIVTPKRKDKLDKTPLTMENTPIFGDTMVSTRTLLLLNLHDSWCLQYFNEEDLDTVIEIGEYLFQSPFKRGNALKSMISMMKQKVFSLAPRSFSNIGVTYDFPEQRDFNSKLEVRFGMFQGISHEFFNVLSKSYYEKLETLRKVLPLTARLYHYFLTATITPENLSRVVFWMFPESVLGFLANSLIHTGIKQYSEAPVLDQEAPLYPFAFARYKSIIENGLRDGLFPKDKQEFHAAITNFLTATSSGLPPTSFTVNDPLGRKTQIIKSSDKTTTILTRGTSLLEKSFADTLMTEENPSYSTTRRTAGRIERVAVNTPVTFPAYESVIAAARQRYVRNEPRIGTFEASSNVLSNQRRFISGHPYKLFVGEDASSWDATFKYFNGRKPLLDAIKSIAREAWPEINAYGFETVQDILLYVYGRYLEVYLEVRDPSAFSPSTKGLPKSQISVRLRAIFKLFTVMMSGAHGTFDDNSIINLAMTDAFPQYLSEAKINMDWLTPVFDAVAGDDKLRAFIITRDPTYKEVDELLDAFKDWMTMNGFITARDKTDVSAFMSFTKVQFLGGFNLPRRGVQLWSKERVTKGLNPIQFYSSFLGLINTLMSRGGDIRYLHYVLLTTWNFGRQIIGGKKRDGAGENALVPYEVLFKPTDEGFGIGASISPMIGSGTLWNEVLIDPSHQAFIDRVYRSTGHFDTTSEKQRTVKDLARNPEFYEKFTKGIDFVIQSIPSHRFKEANQVLTDPMYSDIKFRGLELEKEAVSTLLLKSAASNIVEKMTKRHKLKSALNYIKSPATMTYERRLLTAFKFEFVPFVDPPVLEYNIKVGQDPSIDMLFKYFGVHTHDYSGRSSIDSALARLRSSGLRREISPDALVDFLSQTAFDTPDKMIAGLRGIGVDGFAASAFVGRYFSMIRLYYTSKLTMGISLGYDTYSTLDLRPVNVRRFVDFDVSHDNFESFLLYPAISILISYFFYKYFSSDNPTMYKIRISFATPSKRRRFAREYSSQYKSHLYKDKMDLSTILGW